MFTIFLIIGLSSFLIMVFFVINAKEMKEIEKEDNAPVFKTKSIHFRTEESID